MLVICTMCENSATEREGTNADYFLIGGRKFWKRFGGKTQISTHT